MQAGDTCFLKHRINPNGSIPAINRCIYLDFDPEMEGPEGWWKDQARQKLEMRETHWTSTMKDGGS